MSFEAAVNGPAHRRSACIPQPPGPHVGEQHERRRAAPRSGVAPSGKRAAGLWVREDVAHEAELLLSPWRRDTPGPSETVYGVSEDMAPAHCDD